MHLTKEEILDYLADRDIVFTLYEHIPLFTCEQAQKTVEELHIPGVGIKNLFLKDHKKRLYLISAAATTRIDLKVLGRALSTKELRFADAALLKQHLGVEPGSVTPLALIHDKDQAVQLILDAELSGQEYIQVHPMRNDATIVLSVAGLLCFLNSINQSYVVFDFE